MSWTKSLLPTLNSTLLDLTCGRRHCIVRGFLGFYDTGILPELRESSNSQLLLIWRFSSLEVTESCKCPCPWHLYQQWQPKQKNMLMSMVMLTLTRSSCEAELFLIWFSVFSLLCKHKLDLIPTPPVPNQLLVSTPAVLHIGVATLNYVWWWLFKACTSMPWYI